MSSFFGNPMGNALFTASYKEKAAKYVFWEDSAQNNFGNILNGGTFANAPKYGGYAFAGDLCEYTIPFDSNPNVKLLKSWSVTTAVESTGKVLKVIGNSDGFCQIPEIGTIVMAEVATVATTGQSGMITAVEADVTSGGYTITLDTALGVIAADTVICEAAGTAASATALPYVTNPNIFLLEDHVFPVAGSGFDLNIAAVTVHGAYNKKAYTCRMSPIPKHLLVFNTSRIDGTFGLNYLSVKQRKICQH